MTIENIILILIAGVGLIHGIWLASYIGLSAKKSTSKTLLTWLLLFFAYRIGKSVALHFLEDLEWLFVFTGLAAMQAIGPLLYFYFRAVTDKLFHWKTGYWLHFLPASITAIVAFYIHEGWFLPNKQYLMIVLVSLFYGQFLAYIMAAYKVYTSFKKQSKIASFYKLSAWLRMVLVGISLIWLAYFLNIFEDAIPYIAGPILYSIVIYVLTFYAVRLNILAFDPQSIRSPEEIQANDLKYEAIKHFLESEEGYLDPNLSLANLAKAVNLSPRQLSKLINECTGKNFNEFLNTYRIRRSQELLQDGDNAHLTIMSVAIDSGFNSLSSFNSAFKKLNGTTPSVYRKSFQVELS